LTAVIGAFLFYLFTRQTTWCEVKGRSFKKWSKVGETRRNSWKYQEFKSTPHYESMHVCEASA